ncbi:uncharacterized protein LY89DRAFT_3376 [Mollisia scopiformis]|uniref:Uncharacterized protein n=1 Tax=Mollisia scopiformis TaxID=149040 RepID=A0A194XVR6_MOLSC|nr:uncharacterized protein LY89DRAFT_3376 [Mollisia scopiformis]KUJ23807.1 hypothetical protein LY89DRAFT_3376 [Mollisia scopiformis]
MEAFATRMKDPALHTRKRQLRWHHLAQRWGNDIRVGVAWSNHLLFQNLWDHPQYFVPKRAVQIPNDHKNLWYQVKILFSVFTLQTETHNVGALDASDECDSTRGPRVLASATFAFRLDDRQFRSTWSDLRWRKAALMVGHFIRSSRPWAQARLDPGRRSASAKQLRKLDLLCQRWRQRPFCLPRKVCEHLP